MKPYFHTVSFTHLRAHETPEHPLSCLVPVNFGRGGSQGQRVMKGKKMSGHYGQELVTIQNLPIVDIDLSKNLILIKGSVPGPKNSLVIIKTTNRVKNFKKMSNIVKNSKVENQNIDAAA